MKATIKKIVDAYKALGEAKVTKLEESEVIKVIKARKAMRPIAEEYDEFFKDCQEKFKPESWDSIQKDLQQWQKLTEARRIELDIILRAYQKKIDEAVKDELEREAELNIATLKEESATKILVENGWSVGKLDEIDIVL